MRDRETEDRSRDHHDTGAPASEAEQAPAEPVAAGDESVLGVLARAGDDSLQEMMAGNFIEYASYVIKDRAIPDVADGLKPVQRRILHSLYELDDGRLHKVANIIGHTMRYHPHGDAAIGSALVVLANKEFFIDRQGNFGNIYTGDEASASRYIECRLSPLAREVLFNPEITEYADSYDGRNREPLTLPAKVPALLMLGADGIAVGLTTRILPHNFGELLQAQIAILKGENFRLFPDFLTGGEMDVKEYDDGRGRVKVRAKIDILDDKTLVIREVPPTTTTESLMSSIEDAARRNKIRIANISDFTGEKPEIQITLPRGVHADDTLQRLYVYTDCEVSLTSTLTVIRDQRPVQMSASEVLRYNTDKLLEDLRRELEIELGKLQERFHEKTLVQIFIENRIYKRIEECETYERVLAEVRAGLDRFRHLLRRDITDADIEKLLQIQIRRISLFDMNRNRDELDDILKATDQVQHDLGHLKVYAIKYIRGLLKKYGDQYPRRTRIEDLAEIDAREVALRNVKVGHDRLGKFVGSEVKNSNKDEEPLLCTEFDRLVLLSNDGTFKVVPIPTKAYVGPLKVVLRADKAQVYSMIYRDRRSKSYYAKRFRIDRYIMDKEYSVAPDGCIIEALYTNYGVVVRGEFAPRKRLRATYVDVTFDDVPIRSTPARGFKIADHEIASFVQLKRGTTTLPGSEGYRPEGEDGETPPTAPVEGANGAGNGAAPATPAAPTRTAAAVEARPPPPATPDEGDDAPEPVPGPKPVARRPLPERRGGPTPAPATPSRGGAMRVRADGRASRPSEPTAPRGVAPRPRPGGRSTAATVAASPTDEDAAQQPAARTGRGDSAAPAAGRGGRGDRRREPPAPAAPPAGRERKREPPPPAAKPAASRKSGGREATETRGGHRDATPPSAPPPAAEETPRGGKPKLPLRKRIDEETPFFLE